MEGREGDCDNMSDGINRGAFVMEGVSIDEKKCLNDMIVAPDIVQIYPVI